MKVVLYGSETCGKCDVLKKKLAQADIDFEFISDESIVTSVLPEGEHIPMLKVDDKLLTFSDTCKWIKER